MVSQSEPPTNVPSNESEEKKVEEKKEGQWCLCHENSINNP